MFADLSGEGPIECSVPIVNFPDVPAVSMHVEAFTFSSFMTNCYLCHDNGEAVLVDASCVTTAEQQQVLQVIEENDLDVRHLLLTHAHVDHIFGCRFFEEQFDMPFTAHEASVPFIERADEQAKAFGVEVEPPTVPTTFLSEGDTVSFGNVTLDVLHTPGHSPDSISFVHEKSRQALTGDVLFQNSIGRTQGLPETSRSQLLDSIVEKLLPLGDDVTIYPGHGPKTTIGRERDQNPFVKEALGESGGGAGRGFMRSGR
jgi:glyoxylase-like metal-dependent hydrolase (beta-lactamase superfamily II)